MQFPLLWRVRMVRNELQAEFLRPFERPSTPEDGEDFVGGRPIREMSEDG